MWDNFHYYDERLIESESFPARKIQYPPQARLAQTSEQQIAFEGTGREIAPAEPNSRPLGPTGGARGQRRRRGFHLRVATRLRADQVFRNLDRVVIRSRARRLRLTRAPAADSQDKEQQDTDEGNRHMKLGVKVEQAGTDPSTRRWKSTPKDPVTSPTGALDRRRAWRPARASRRTRWT